MRTREVAARAGVNAQTLRYYERRGILADPPRSPAGYRDYPASAVQLLRFVKRAQELGFSLAKVDGEPDPCDGVRTLAEAHLAEPERKIADLERIRASLAALVATCERPRADRSCALLAAIESDVALTLS